LARIKGRDRRLGWKPPNQINVKITDECYQYVQQAVTKNQRNVPFYSTLESIIKEYDQLRYNLQEKEDFLALAMDEKKQLEKANKELKERLQQFNS
jgi:hypothetical protein